MRVNRNIIIAVVFAVLILSWVVSGLVGKRHDKVETPSPGPIATAAGEAETLFRVRARTMKAEPRAAELTIRGQTVAERSVRLRSETAGTIERLAVEKGATVKAGDVICQLAADARQAQLAGARAAMKQAELEHQASVELAKKGYRSETQVAASRAQLDGARAQVRAAEIEVERTKLRAPFNGIVDDRYVEVGDFMPPGADCAMIVDLDPILIVASVSERDVGLLSVGASGRAKLATGAELEGKIRFVARAADPQARTYRVELEVPNPERAVRDGITADLRLPIQEVQAHKISPAILGLNETGVVGVRIITADQTVAFIPVTVISDDADGVWVTGLPETVTVITVGQEYVVPGQKIEAVIEDEVART